MKKDKTIKVENGMDWKKWGLKVGKQSLIVLIAGTASVYGDNPLYLMLAPIVNGIENYIKHR